MLQPLPPGFPTPEPTDPENVARELGRASAMWMRGAYPDAAKKVDEAAQLAAFTHANDRTKVDAARVASLLRVSAALATLVEEMTSKGVTDPASIAISLEIDTENLTDSELAAAQSMEVVSADIESVREPAKPSPANAPIAKGAKPPAAPAPLPPRSPRALSTTLQQASRPTIPDAPRIDVVVPNIESARTIDLRRTLPEGVRDPRVPKPTPRPFPKVAAVDGSTTATVTTTPSVAISEPFKDLDVPSSELAVTTNPVPYGAKYPPSEAQPSGTTTKRAPAPAISAEESTDPAPPPPPPEPPGEKKK